MEALAAASLEVLGRRPARVTPLQGGDLSEVLQLTFEDGGEVVAKRGPLVGREARMLGAIADAGVPSAAVLGVSGNVMFLETLEEVRPTPDHWARFGHDLARLHATPGDGYGWAEDYAFGAVRIHNAATETWPDFWARRRLLPFVPEIAPDLGARVERLAARLGDLLPVAPLPGLLHGDLWTGNLLATPEAIHLIDPACYFGHGEVDLAMLHLFGGPGPGFQDAYGVLEPGWETRRAVYSLFPALVHLRLFGDGYRAMVTRFLDQAGH